MVSFSRKHVAKLAHRGLLAGIFLVMGLPEVPAILAQGAAPQASSPLILRSTIENLVRGFIPAGIKKLTDKPIRFLIDTEVHNDHTFGHYVFSPPAVVINHEGAGEGMKKNFDPKRIETLKAQSPEMSEAVKNYKFIPPQIEYKDKMTINLGERTFELLYLKNVHSEADTAIWLPKERVLFAASAANVKSIINLRPFVTIPDILASYKLMKSLNPEVVVPGHGPVSTTKIFDEYEGFYTLLLKRVTEMANQGKSLDEIKKELKMPEYADWAGQDRLGVNIDVAYKSVTK